MRIDLPRIASDLPQWNILSLWWHALRSGHRMAVERDGACGPRFRFCWDCDRQQVEKALGFPLRSPKGRA